MDVCVVALFVRETLSLTNIVVKMLLFYFQNGIILEMKKWLFLLLLTSTIALAKTRIVILDTGLNLQDPRFIDVLCKDFPGVDFTGEGINDLNSHGTHIAGIIKKYAGPGDYCFTIVKYYKVSNSGEENLKNMISSLKFIHYLKPNVVNISSGGPEWNDDEYSNIKDSPETTFITAVGNDNINLDKECDYFPACYKLNNIIKVGSLKSDGKRKSDFSNFGNVVNVYEIGENVMSTIPNNETTVMSGTSLSGSNFYRKIHT